MLDERWIRSLHVETLREEELHAEREPHVLFQASTIGALLDGAYDGDLSFAELAEHGDLGLGTLNGLDGEMIALDGAFYRADVEGRIDSVAPQELTPFAVVTRFEPTVEAEIDRPLAHQQLLARLDELVPAGASSCAIRLDGSFESVRARSVPRQRPPYRPLAEVVAEQHGSSSGRWPGRWSAFAFRATSRGSRSPATTCTSSTPIVSGRARARFPVERCAGATRPSDDLHVELPPEVALADPGLSAETHRALVRAEGG